LIFLGYGPERETLEHLTRRLGLEDRVLFLDPVAPDEVLAYTAGATIGVTLLEDTCLNHRYALPNKLFDYLMAGVPVLASDLPELRTLVQGYNVGKTADSSDPDDVARALMEMLGSETDRNTWIRNAERLCETFNWENASQRFTKAFRRLIPVGKAD
jgi:glycosyltransferase involved in cell wall biosynthesis